MKFDDLTTYPMGLFKYATKGASTCRNILICFRNKIWNKAFDAALVYHGERPLSTVFHQKTIILLVLTSSATQN